MCLTVVLLATGQRLAFATWSKSVWTPSAPLESMVFDELVLYVLFPLVVVVGTVVSTTLSRSRPFAVSLLGTSPVFVGIVVLRRFEMVSMALLLVAFTLLCFSIVKLTNRLWATKHRGQQEVSPRT
jgi:hypothetical protein